MRHAFALFMTTHGARKKIEKIEKKWRKPGLMFLYSVGIVGGYAAAKFLTPRMPQLKSKRFHLHHWMWSTALILGAFVVGAPDVVYGALVGVALQGLSYKNWGIKRKT